MNRGSGDRTTMSDFPPHHMSNYKKLSISHHFMLHAQRERLVPIGIVAFRTRFPSVWLLMQAAEMRRNQAKGLCGYWVKLLSPNYGYSPLIG